MIPRLLFAPVLALVLAGVAPTSVAASCVAPPSVPDQIKTAALVFVGTVLYTYDGDRVAHVKVESIWKGPQLPKYVNVHGSPASGAAATSVDRHYKAGTRYLFVLYSAEQPLQDNDCTGTQAYTSALAPLKPSDARPPTVGYATDPPVGPQYGGALVILTLVIGAVVFAVAAVRGR